MGYDYQEKFEVDLGYRWYRGRISILVHALSFGNAITALQSLAYVQTVDGYRNRIKGDAQNAETASPDQLPLGVEDFTEVKSEPFYKYVGDDTWSYLKRGQFRFGTADYYRCVENNGIRDEKEGFGHFHLQSNAKQLNVSLCAGNNCVVYCGTGKIEGAADQSMRERFGSRRIRIDNLNGFAQRANNCLGSKRFRVFDVVYRDIKSYTAEFPGVERFLEITRRNNLTPSSMRKLNREFFKTFYEFGIVAGVLVKPTRYSVERERRLVFELRRDRRDPFPVGDKKLLDFVTFLPD